MNHNSYFVRLPYKLPPTHIPKMVPSQFGNIWQHLWLLQLGVVVATGVWWVEDRKTAKYPQGTGHSPTTKNHQGVIMAKLRHPGLSKNRDSEGYSSPKTHAISRNLEKCSSDSNNKMRQISKCLSGNKTFVATVMFPFHLPP